MLNSEQSRRLLDRLCVELGFCLAPAEVQRLVHAPPADVQGFVEAVISAEGLDPASVRRALHRQVRDVVAEAFANADRQRYSAGGG